MMPPKTAMGIINFFIDEKNEHLLGNSELWKLRDHFIILNTNEDAQLFPDKCMRLHKSITMNGANQPSEELLVNALKKRNGKTHCNKLLKFLNLP